VKESQRLIVPDLARGMALIGIAMANTLQSWIVNGYSAADAPGWSIGGINPDSPLDAWAAVFTTMFVRVRGLPMFSTLLGIGFGMVAASLARKGYGPALRHPRLLRGLLRFGRPRRLLRLLRPAQHPGSAQHGPDHVRRVLQRQRALGGRLRARNLVHCY